MINTIFYFKDHLPFDEYVSKVNSGDIAEHTIVFVEDTKAIYKGGAWYGSTSDPDNTSKIIELIRENEYVLPIASSLKLGGIRIGSNLDISNDGVLSVDTESLPKYDDTAIKNRLDVIEESIGNDPSDPNNPTSGQDTTLLSRLALLEIAVRNIKEVTATPLLNNGVKIATITVGNVSSDIYAPAATLFPEPGSQDDPYSYDDTTLRDWLSDLEALINTTRLDLLGVIASLSAAIEGAKDSVNTQKDRLDGIIDDLDSTIEDRIETLFNDPDWVELNLEGVISTNPQNNFGVQDVEEYLQEIGLWARTGEGNVTKTDWSSIRLRVNNVEISVNSLILPDGNGDLGPTEALTSWINAAIDGAVASIENGTAYARISDVDGILEWLYSGLKASTSQNLTYSQLVSAAKNNLLGTTAIAGLTTRVEAIEGSYVALSSLSSKVDESIATILTEASLNSALVSALASIGNNITGLTSRIETVEGNVVSTTTLLNSVYNEITNNTLQSGILSAIDARSQTVTLDIVNAIKDENDNVTAASIMSSIITNNTAKLTLSTYINSVTTVNENGDSVDQIVSDYVDAIFEAALGNVSFTAFAAEVRGNTTAISGLQTRVTAIDGPNSNYITTANIGTKIENIQKGTGVWAGLVTEAKLGTDIQSATTTLQATLQNNIDGKVSNDSASIILAVNGSGGSSAKISADKVDITGTAVFKAINGSNSNNTTTIEGSMIKTGSITADKIIVSEIVAAINNSTGSSKLTIDADHVNITGSTIFGLINGNNGNTTTIEGSKIKTGTITASQINTTDLSVAAANITGTLTANQIDATNLQVAAANITGKLTATLINSSNLHVNAANIDGTLTVTAANVSGLTGAIQSTTIDGSLITTGTISAARIDATDLHVAAANIDGTISAGKINTSGLVIGSSDSYSVSTDGSKVKFNYQNNSNAYFTSENGGMQLYIKGPGGDWYSIDFSKWNNTTNPQPSYPGHSLTIYKLRGGGLSLSIVSDTKTIYYESSLSFDNINKQRRFGRCYTDEQGLNSATSSTLTGTWYYAPQDTSYFALVETSSLSNTYEPVIIRPLLPVTIGNDGILLAQDKDASVMYAAGIEATADLSTATKYIEKNGDNPISVDNVHIYSNTGNNTPIGGTSYDTQESYYVYPLSYTNTMPTNTNPQYVSVLGLGLAWTVTTVNTYA